MELPRKSGVGIFKKEKSGREIWLDEQEEKLAHLMRKADTDLQKKKFLDSIDSYYKARNFYDTFRKYEMDYKKKELETELFDFHRKLFDAMAKEINLLVIGDRYDEAMYLYELLRIFSSNSSKYLEYRDQTEYYKRLQEIYNSMIAIYKLHKVGK